MFQNQPIGVPGQQMPNYLGNLSTMQQPQQQNFGDKARSAMANGLGMGGVTDQSGRFDWQKIGGMAKKFCV